MFLYRCKHIERFSNVHEGAFKKEHNDNNERSDTIDKWRDINHILITQAVTSTRKSSKLNKIMAKYIVELEVILNFHVNIEVQHIANVIQNIFYLNKFLWFFTMNQTLIIILS